MKKNRYLPASLCLALLLAPAASFAARTDGPKAKAMAKYDLNNDGKLDTEEIAAIQKDFAAAPSGDLKRHDKDGDGKLSADEIAAMIPGSGKKSTDTKKTGDGKKSTEAKKSSAEKKGSSK